jgi:hypothetical protein
MKRGIARRNWRCNFCPATARMKPSVRWKNEPVRAPSRTHADVESEQARKSWQKLPLCARRCGQHQAHNLLTCSVSARLLANRLTIDYQIPPDHAIEWHGLGRAIAAHETLWSSLCFAFIALLIVEYCEH